jgi:hypothetical protein
MPDYSLGKVYKIVGNGKTYVGSTTRTLLSQRLAAHRYKFKSWKNDQTPYYTTSFECLDDSNCFIELLEMCPCSCRDELDRCEGKWIRETECVNKTIAGRTQEEYKNENIELHNAYQKEWRENNKEYPKQYYHDNKQKFIEAQRRYRESKKNKIIS